MTLRLPVTILSKALSPDRILLENRFPPGDLESQIDAFVDHCNHRRYHGSLANLVPADVYIGRGQTILKQREKTNAKPSTSGACYIAKPQPKMKP